MSEILASWMLFRASDIVSKLHDPWTNHVTVNLDILKRWTNGKIPSERVSQLHKAWGSLPNLELLSKSATLRKSERCVCQSSGACVMLELVVLVHNVSRLYDARPAKVRHRNSDQ